MRGTAFSPRVILRLRNRVRPIEEKSYDLFENFFPDVHCAVDAIARLTPIYLPCGDLPLLSFSAIAELDVEQIPAHDHRYPVEGITVPRGCFPWRQPLPPDQVISPMMQYLWLCH